MASKKYTELPAAGALDGSEIIAIVQGGVSKQTTVSAVGAGGAGTVTSFSAGNLSPLFTTSVANATTTPALTFSLSNQNANLVFAGPATGAAAAPTFRALVAADLPAGTIQDLQSVLDTGSSATNVTTAVLIQNHEDITLQTIGTGKTILLDNLDGGAVSITATVNIIAGGVVYPWPSAAPVGNGYVLTSQTDGTLSWTAPSASGITIGTTTITSGTDTRILYNNAGVVGEYSVGAGVATFIGTPSWTNFSSMITGTAPFWSLATGGALTANNTISGAFSVTFTNSVVNSFVLSGTVSPTTATNQQYVNITPTITTRANTSDVFRAVHVAPTITAGAASQTLYAFMVDASGIAITNTPTKYAGYFLGGLRVGNGSGATSNNTLLVETTQTQTIFNITSNGNSIFSVNNNSGSTILTLTGLAATPANGLGVVGTFTTTSGACQMLSLNGTMVAGANSDVLRGIRLFPSFTISTRTGIVTHGLHYQPQAISVSSGSFSAHNGVIVDGSVAAINIFSGFMVTTPTAFLHLGPAATAAASLRIEASANTPSGPNSGDIWHASTNNRLMFRQGANTKEIVVSDGTTTAGTTASGTIRVTINGTDHDLLRV
jgi:hypothetical protein